jgi:NadR type nicotinamide-nucleotide adenylyltransferase
MSIKKIVVIGPESTGKSTLCFQLAEHYQTLWCPEYAREFLEKNGADYRYDDLLTIAKGQIELENKVLSKADRRETIVFIDTDMYVMKVWCEFAFNKCHSWILNEIATRKYDLYLLCNVDLPWIKDKLREYPDKTTRLKLYNFYKDIMINQSVPWVDIRGSYEERLSVAIKAIDAQIANTLTQK